MPQRKQNIEDTFAWTIYECLKIWAEEKHTLATKNGFLQVMRTHFHYDDLSYGKFRYHWNELQLAGFIAHEPLTNAVIVRDVAIVDRELFERLQHEAEQNVDVMPNMAVDSGEKLHYSRVGARFPNDF